MSEQEAITGQATPVAAPAATDTATPPVQATEAGNAPAPVTASTETSSADVAAPIPVAPAPQTEEPIVPTPAQTASQSSESVATGPNAAPVSESAPEPAAADAPQAPVSAPAPAPTSAVPPVQAAEAQTPPVPTAPAPQPAADTPSQAATPSVSAAAAAPAQDHYFARLDYLLSNYVSTMVPGKMLSLQDGINTQRSLLELFRHVLGADTTKAKQAFETMFATINQHRNTVFAESNVYRYFSALKDRLTKKEFELHQQLTHLFINAANPSTREAMMKQIDMNKLSENLDSHKQFMNLSAFFSNRL